MKTEFVELDKYIDIDEPKLILLGGEKGVGKTTLLSNIAVNLSLHQNISVLFFSLEEDYIRMDMKRLDYDEFDYSINKLNYSKLFVKDKMPITIDEITQCVRKYVEKENVEFVMLDNIKLIQYDKNKIFDEDDNTKHSMEILKQLSIVFNITIFVTCDLDYFGKGNFKLSNYWEEEYMKMADIFMIMHEKDNEKEVREIYISKQNSNITNKIELIRSCYNFQYLNTSSNKNADFISREKRMLKKIEDNKIVFLNPNEFEINRITNIIEENFKKKKIKYKICDFFENSVIEEIIDNKLEEYIETFKDIEAVIFVIYTYDFTDKIKKFVYSTSQKILNCGVKKKGIFVSEFYGVIPFSISDEFEVYEDDTLFF